MSKTVSIENNKFTEVLENYWMLKLVNGEKEALLWLRDYLRSEAGLLAVEELVVQAVEQANDMMEQEIDLEDYEDAVEERKGKKTEELN